MITFLKTILIILLVYYTLKFSFRFFGPYLMRFIAKKASQRFENAFGGNPFQQPNETSSGNTSFDKVPKKNTRTSKKVVGEYVDFEEID